MKDYRIDRTNQDNTDFISLVKELDKDLWNRNEENQSAYTEFNMLDTIDQVLVLYEKGTPIGCGCFKIFDDQTIEIKRMFVKPGARGKGYSKAILLELETWAKETGNSYSVLETGKNQIEAIGLYKKSGYNIIPNYPPYEDMQNSICFKKSL